MPKKVMSAQQIFNKVSAHLLAQKKKSLINPRNPDAGCAYRSPDGLKCAVGCLITDKEYSPKMEGRGVVALVQDRCPSDNKLYPWRGKFKHLEPHGALLRDLQGVHDQNKPSLWRGLLIELATLYGLTFKR